MNPLKVIGLWTTVAFSIPGSFQLQPVDEIPNHINTPVRVLLGKGLPGIRVSSEFHSVYLKAAGQIGWTTLNKKAAIHSIEQSGKRQFVVNGKLYGQEFLILRGGPVFTDPITFQLRRFRGALRLQHSKVGIDVINVVPIEDYLVSTVGSEMHASWEMEALRTQSVAARSYALYRVTHPRSKNYDLESTTRDQVYNGVESENVRTRRAVTSTAGEFLTTASYPMEALYHSNCGGETEKMGTFKNVPCPFCRSHPQTWEYRFNTQSLGRALGLKSSAIDMIPIEKTASGRVSRLKFLTPEGESLTLSGEQLRGKMGYNNLKSTLLGWQFGSNEVLFYGKGAGHGIGLCQWGARHLAKLGKNYKEILSHYYPAARLSNQTLLPSKVARMW